MLKFLLDTFLILVTTVLTLCALPVVFSLVLVVLTTLVSAIVALVVLGVLKAIFTILKILLVRNRKLQAPEQKPLGGKVKSEEQIQVHA